MFSIKINYPSFDEERLIVKNTTYNIHTQINNTLSKEEILEAQEIVRDILISDELIDYILKVVRSTRPETSEFDIIKKNVSWGAGPRASQYLTLSAKANALLNGRMYCVKDDILNYLENILAHRVLLNFNALAENITVSEIIEFLKSEIN